LHIHASETLPLFRTNTISYAFRCSLVLKIFCLKCLAFVSFFLSSLTLPSPAERGEQGVLSFVSFFVLDPETSSGWQFFCFCFVIARLRRSRGNPEVFNLTLLSCCHPEFISGSLLLRFRNSRKWVPPELLLPRFGMTGYLFFVFVYFVGVKPQLHFSLILLCPDCNRVWKNFYLTFVLLMFLRMSKQLFAWLYQWIITRFCRFLSRIMQSLLAYFPLSHKGVFRLTSVLQPIKRCKVRYFHWYNGKIYSTF